MKQYKFLLVVILLNSIKVIGQGSDPINYGVKIASTQFKNKTVIPPSPEAAELGKYGNIPVSLFSGSPKVSVPIYDIQGTSLSLPISLSYDASGFNPQKQATWVGLNWALNAGGVITRSVIGNPDRTPEYFNGTTNYGVPTGSEQFEYYQFLEDMKKGNRETQPDVYYYNFGNYSGKFVLRPDLTIVKKDRSDLKFVSFDPTSVNSIAYIIDDKGNKYTFAYTEASTTMLDDRDPVTPAQNLTYYYPSAWYLSSIESADGKETITFSYHTNSENQTQFSNYLSNQSVSYQSSAGSSSLGAGELLTSPAPVVTLSNKRSISQIVFSTSSGMVARIEFESSANSSGNATIRQDVDNTATPGERRLDRIIVYNRDNRKIREVQFNYGYFVHAQNPNTWFYKRLRLQSVQELPIDGSMATKPAHIFEYINQNGNMPSRYTSGLDHWGYYNGLDGQLTIVPNVMVDGVSRGGGADREPTLAGSSTFMISKVYYPTGGYTEFEYELHKGKTGLHSQAVLLDVGGIRIKKITDFAFQNRKATIKNYSYNDGANQSTGIVCAKPEYLSFSSYTHYCGGCTYGDPEPSKRKEYLNVSANSVHDLGTIQGSHIGYTEVTEFMTDENNVPLGKTVYKYAVGSPGSGRSDDAPENWSLGEDDAPNGDLLEKSVYDKESKILLKEENIYNYRTTGLSLASVKLVTGSEQSNKTRLIKYNNGPNIAFTWGLFANECSGSPSWGNGTEPSTDPVCNGAYIAQRIITTRFQLALGYLISETEKQQVKSIIRKYDQLSNGQQAFTRNIAYGNTDHIYPTRIEENTAGNEWVVTEKKYAADYSIPTNVTLDAASKGIQNLLASNIRSAEIESIQFLQNSNGTNKRYINGSITIYDQTRPLPLQLLRLEIAQPLSSLPLSSISESGQFTYNSSYSPEASFVYDQVSNTMVQQQKDKDIPMSYVWDYDNHLPIAEVSNALAASAATNALFAYTSFETSSRGNWTVSQPPHIQTQVAGGITGNFSYNLVAGASISKASMDASRKYILSYWSKNGPVTLTLTGSGAVHTVIQGATRLGWIYYEHRTSLNVSAVTITGSGINIDELRLYPSDALMSTVTYDPLIGVTSQCNANSSITYFEYDNYNRLVNVRDQDGNIVKNFKYNYGLGTAITPSAQSLFYNQVASAPFARQCTNGGEPTTVTYTVPYGRYVSTSQTAANQMASTDIQTNGQSYANQVGECRFYNTQQQSSPVLRNNCIESGYGPPIPSMGVVYIVPARSYYSLFDLPSANALAMADVSANKQQYANINGLCTCMEFGKKYIVDGPNSRCVDGVKIYTGIKVFMNGNWNCQYYYSYEGSQDDGNYGYDLTTEFANCAQQ